MSSPVVVVVGAGPGVSGSLARRFGREGCDTALVGLDPEVLDALGGELRSDRIKAAVAHAVDVTDTEAFKAALASIGDGAGRIDVLHFNPSAFRQKSPLELSPEELAEDVGLGVGALLTAVQGSRPWPFMSAGGRVTATSSMESSHAPQASLEDLELVFEPRDLDELEQ